MPPSLNFILIHLRACMRKLLVILNTMDKKKRPGIHIRKKAETIMPKKSKKQLTNNTAALWFER